LPININMDFADALYNCKYTDRLIYDLISRCELRDDFTLHPPRTTSNTRKNHQESSLWIY